MTASLKAAQVGANLLLLQSTVETVSTRLLIQNALRRYRDEGNNTEANWVLAHNDLKAALAGGGNLLMQAALYPIGGDGPAGSSSVLNFTSDRVSGQVQLPYRNASGDLAMLGEGPSGFPPQLYPNLTYVDEPTPRMSNLSRVSVFKNRTITPSSPVLLGPLQIDSTSALLSITVVIINNTVVDDVLGYLTAVVDARQIANVVSSSEGLENDGGVLLIGPDTPDNRFPVSFRSAQGPLEFNDDFKPEDVSVRFVWTPLQSGPPPSRHSERAFGRPNTPFPLADFPAVREALATDSGAARIAGSILSTRNEDGDSVAVGYSRLGDSLCDWLLIVEQDRYKALSPIRRLRNVLLACVFGTLGVILLLVFPVAHFFVRPIRRLRQATKESVEPPSYDSDMGSRLSADSRRGGGDGGDGGGSHRDGMVGDEKDAPGAPKEYFARKLTHWRQHKPKPGGSVSVAGRRHGRRSAIRIPRRVQDGKHVVQDELTDLTETFNEMADELMVRYEQLEDRVRERTRELELSKKAAEAANESKTLFIANISHEFRTPLNAILGLTAVCMEEDDLVRVKRSLGIIYRSGDLLLHLLTDLLTFSKNQIGQQLSLDEREFRLTDIGLQVSSIFETQAGEGGILLRTSYGASEAGGNSVTTPSGANAAAAAAASSSAGDGTEILFGTSKVKDVVLWGDQNRILQVVINLVSNSLKFTPAGGSIHFRVRCMGEIDGDAQSQRMGRKTSAKSNPPSLRTISGNLNTRVGSIASAAASADETSKVLSTALTINPMEPGPLARVHSQDRSFSPPTGSKTFAFEFEVEDTGPGIPEHLQKRIFEPFVQGDLGLSKKYGGTGLGLSICSQLAKLMGGSIDLRSQIGTGSTFTMRIPLKTVRTRPESSASSTPNVHSRPPSTVAPNLPEEVVVSGMNAVSTQDRPGTTYPRQAASVASDGIGDGVPKPSASTHGAGTNPRLVGLSQPFFASGPLPNPVNVAAVATTTSAAAAAVASTPAVFPERPKSKDRVRILVAEDNQVNQEVVLRMLKLEEIFGTHRRFPFVVLLTRP